jgi:sugar lactone lactonase YvrE
MSAPRITCLGTLRARVGEGAMWDVDDQALWWVDIPAGLVHRHDPSGPERSWEIGEAVGCLARCATGGLLLATRSGFHRFDPETGTRHAIADPEAAKPDNRFNDGTTDPRGRFWAGTMKDRGDPAPAGAFWRLDPDLSVTAGASGFWTTNGLAFAPDGRTIYFADSHPSVRLVWRAAYDVETGTHGTPEPFFDTRAIAGRPDGATVDADGCYWLAGVNGWQVVRITPAGKLDRIVEMPVERPSRPMWGGARLDTLYVTSIGVGLTPGTEARQPDAGALFAITGLGTGGLPQTRFAG